MGELGCDSECCVPNSRLSAGASVTFLQSRFSGNLAFTQSESDNLAFDRINDRSFSYDLDAGYRFWLDWSATPDLDFRVTYWQFDQRSDEISASPAANGLGLITAPRIGLIDLSTDIATDVFRASQSIDAHTIDLEVRKHIDFGCWQLTGTSGLRIASLTQDYSGTLVNVAGATRGNLNTSNQLDGIGPSVGLELFAPVTYGVRLFGNGRAAVLFGQHDLTVSAIENANTANAFTTQRLFEQDGLAPTFDTQLGLEYTGRDRPLRLRLGFEGQAWQGVGSSTALDSSNVGFVGLFGQVSLLF